MELTAGGGGRSETRLTKVKERNKKLDGQRVCSTTTNEPMDVDCDNLQIEHREKLAKIAAKGGEAPVSALPERPQRFSTTSGLEQSDAGKRTWTVGDVEDDGQTHRGGRKHIRGKKGGAAKASKIWGTGVNAIPVG